MRKNYVHIDFPPLTDAQRQEINELMLMRDEDINTDDIPVCDFSDAVPYYAQDAVVAENGASYTKETASLPQMLDVHTAEPCYA